MPSVRVLVQPDTLERVEVTIEGRVRVLALPGEEIIGDLAAATLRIQPHGDEVLVDGEPWRLPLRIVPVDSRSFSMRLESEIAAGKPLRAYRGFLDLLAAPVGLRAIHELSIEEYVAGVVGREMESERFPPAALEAQAVAARTFTLYHLRAGGPMRIEEYFMADSAFQAYGGMRYETPRVLDAVRATQGWSLTYQGKLFQSYYHSACGGHTAGGTLFNEQPIPPLAGVACEHCAGAPRSHWQERIPLSEIEAPLSTWATARGVRMGRLLGLAAAPLGAGETIPFVDVRHALGRFEIKAAELRAVIGRQSRSGLASGTFTVSVESTPAGAVAAFEGSGHGHGVGLCQYGAATLAAQSDYRAILSYYYPESGLMKLY